MTTPPLRPGPHGPQPGGHGEQPTQPLRPLSGQQPYEKRGPYAQQPPRREHSGARRDASRRPKNDRTAVVTGIVAVLALLLAGAGVLVLNEDDRNDAATSPAPTTQVPASPPPTGDAGPGEAVDAEVGDCIRVNDASATDADVETIDCADPRAAYRIGLREESSEAECPGENYVSYTEEGALLLCLMLNARQGDCFQETEQQDIRVPCGSPKVSYRVGDIIAGTADASRCGAADARNALTYPRPPLTICRLPVG